jgi:hypothetical protein
MNTQLTMTLPMVAPGRTNADRLAALRVKRALAEATGMSADVAALDVEIANLERFMAGQQNRAGEAT